jgi:valyl-tRNA synthetase
LLHPFMPFVTEELWQRLPGTGDSIMEASWPLAGEFETDPEAEAEMDLIRSVVTGIRSARSEHGIPPGGRLDAVLVCGKGEVQRILERERGYVETLAGLSSMDFSGEAPGEGYGIRVVLEDVQAYVSWKSGVDPAGEIERLKKRIGKVEVELKRCVEKLSNERFVEKAPPEVVEKEREKERELLGKLDGLNGQIEALRL